MWPPSPEYTGSTWIWRLRGKAYTVEAKDKEDLLQAFNRGGFTQGYLLGQPGQKLLSGRIPKHQGVLVGKVLARPKEKDMVDISYSVLNCHWATELKSMAEKLTAISLPI